MAEVDYRTTGVVTAPISLKAVAQLLGEKPDVATVCKSARINMWAKWKPVAHSRPIPLTEGEIEATRYGMTFPMDTDKQTFMARYDGQLNGWAYNKPTEGPYRLTDFYCKTAGEGYDHNAEEPFTDFDAGGEFDLQYVEEIQFGIGLKSVNAGGLTCADLNLGGCYPGVVAQNSRGVAVWVCAETVAQRMAAADGDDVIFTLSVPRSQLLTGTYTVYPALFMDSNGETAIPIPYMSQQTVTLKMTVHDGTSGGSGPVQINVEAQYTDNTRSRIEYTISWENTGSQDYTVTFRIPYGTYDRYTLLTETGYIEVRRTLAAAANDSGEITGTCDITPPGEGVEYWIWPVYFSGDHFSWNAYPIQDSEDAEEE